MGNGFGGDGDMIGGGEGVTSFELSMIASITVVSFFPKNVLFRAFVTNEKELSFTCNKILLLFVKTSV